MKRRFIFLAFMVPSAVCIFGQSGQPERLYIPLINRESQSNVIVSVSDLGEGQPCPARYTNLLSNTNLFTSEQQEEIKTAFSKYRAVTANHGPAGTVLVDSYKTNYAFKADDKRFAAEETISVFQYTNRDAREVIRIGAGFRAEYRTGSNVGYDVSFIRTGAGTLLGFGEIRDNKPHGVFVRLVDMHPQGLAWDYKKADFESSLLSEYKQYSRGYVLGRLFMWNVKNGNLQVQAEFTRPYDWNQNRLQPKW